MATKRRKSKRTVRAQVGAFPGERMKRSTVYDTKHFFDPDHQSTPTVNGFRAVTHIYNTELRRLEREFTLTIQHEGHTWTLPHKVIERIVSDREHLLKAARRERAQEIADRRANKLLVEVDTE